MNRLAASASPISADARPVPSTISVLSCPAASLIACSIADVSKSISGLKMNAAVGCRWLLITALVTPVSVRESAAGLAATTRSHPSRRSAPPQGVHRAVDARAFAVPDAEHPIDRRTGKKSDLLAAPDRGRGQILV